MASCGRGDETRSLWGLPVLPSTQSKKKKKKETRQNCTTNDGPPSQLNSLSDDSGRRPCALRAAFFATLRLFLSTFGCHSCGNIYNSDMSCGFLLLFFPFFYCKCTYLDLGLFLLVRKDI